MKAKRFGRTRAVGHGSVIALLTAALVFFGLTRVIDRPETRLGKVLLTNANDFGPITSTISSSATSKVPALLAPGVTRYFWYTVSNPLSQPITVTSISIPSGGVTAPAGCAATNLDLTHTTFSGPLTVPKKVGSVNGSASVEVGAISLQETGSDQDGCQNKTFNFTYQGTATYAEVYGTSTALASSVNPSLVGQSVTYTATVTGIVGSGQDPLPNSPTGTVTFKDGATTICTASGVAFSSTTATTSTATCTPPSYAVTGTHPITATYTNSDGNFTTSSASLSQVVKLGTTTALASSPNPSIQGTSVTLNATVTKTSGSGTPTGTVSFYKGTPPTGTLLGSGPLNASAVASLATSTLPAGANSLYAVYAGDSLFNTSTSPVITQTVIALPAGCSGTYNLIVGNPSSPNITGTNGNDFIYAPGTTNWTINSGQGNDCIQTGDGNNTITAGNGNSTIVAGNGKNTITAGNGTNTITVGNGNSNSVTVGNGTNSVTVGTGASNTITAGNGNNTFRITSPGNHNTITAGNGTNISSSVAPSTSSLAPRRVTPVTCRSLPASSVNDTLTNCTAVTP